ncbi:MAG: lipid-A-disaccharide synthase, partial [Hyphomicrobiales bacterium]|nr:lipid-A-disaccharide synthase [Hyphomicrobiales bacterium]
MTSNAEPLRIFLVAGEHSGDQLGGKLIPEIRRLAGGDVTFSGVGAEMMAEQGCASLFPLSDVAVMGPLAILGRLPRI